MFRRLSAIAAVVAGSVAITTQVSAQPDFSQVEIETIPVRENIYLLHGEGGNIGLFVGEDGVFLVDDQYAPLTEKIKAAIAEITDEPVKFVINTHWHYDHTGGNENLGNADVLILSHDNVRDRLKTGGTIAAFNADIAPSPDAALPVITYDEGVTFHLNGDTLHAIHPDSNGHTDGDTFLYWEMANVIHAGDLFFSGFYPFIDASSGGSLHGMIEGVNTILSMADEETLIIPGHGELSNRAELLAYRNMLMTVEAKVLTAIANGLSLEEYLASDPTADLDETWGVGFLSPEQFNTIVYTSVAAEAL